MSGLVCTILFHPSSGKYTPVSFFSKNINGIKKGIHKYVGLFFEVSIDDLLQDLDPLYLEEELVFHKNVDVEGKIKSYVYKGVDRLDLFVSSGEAYI